MKARAEPKPRSCKLARSFEPLQTNIERQPLLYKDCAQSVITCRHPWRICRAESFSMLTRWNGLAMSLFKGNTRGKLFSSQAACGSENASSFAPTECNFGSGVTSQKHVAPSKRAQLMSNRPLRTPSSKLHVDCYLTKPKAAGFRARTG